MAAARYLSAGLLIVSLVVLTQAFAAFDTVNNSLQQRRFILNNVTLSWGSWSAWSQCNESCGVVGVKTRSRYCVAGTLHVAPRQCTSGDAQATTPCYLPCPDAIWSPWSEWSKCSVTCSDGIRYRARHCETGSNCKGDVLDSVVCTKPRCLHVVDGQWGSWSGWNTCSKTCGEGVHTQFRSCDNPAPQDGGLQCSGTDRKIQPCKVGECPIDGGWTDFTARPCSVTCGIGVAVSVRFCTNPAPQHGGKTCVGSATKFSTCNTTECVIDGGWTAWSNATGCEVVCGDGFRRQSRSCTNPIPKHGGKDCLGSAVNLTECFNGPCPSDIKVCNRSTVLKSVVVTHDNMIQPGGTVCPSDPTKGTARSLVEAVCNAPTDDSQWKLGIAILENCYQIPLYVPVGVINKQTKDKQYGIMMECDNNVLTVARQNCTSGVYLENIKLDHATSDYHLLLW